MAALFFKSMNRLFQKKRQDQRDSHPLPSRESIASLCSLLLKQEEKRECEARYASVKVVLSLLGRGAVLASAFLSPGAARGLYELVRESPDYDAWKQYNVSYLRRTLRQLEKRKQIELTEQNGETVISLTDAGRRRILRFSLDTVTIEKPKHWDGRWRLVIYDIAETESGTRDLIRQTLRSLGFHQIQESVYLYPYDCFEQIEFIRQYYFVKSRLQYMLVAQIENDEAYRTYFGLT